MTHLLLILGIVAAVAWGIYLWVASRLQQISEKEAHAEDQFERELLTTFQPRQRPLTDPHASPVLSAADSMPVFPPPRQEPMHEADPADFQPMEYEQRLELGGLLAPGMSGEDNPIPGLDQKARLVRLKNQKRMLIAPDNAPHEWVESALRMYEHVLLVERGQARVVRRFEDFLADQLFSR